MVFLLLLLANSILLVAGQTLFKLGADAVTKSETTSQLAENDTFGRILLYWRWEFIMGLFVYAVGTLMYILLLKKYNYFTVQSIMLSMVLILATTSASFIFNEQIRSIQFVGIGAIMLGIALIAR